MAMHLENLPWLKRALRLVMRPGVWALRRTPVVMQSVFLIGLMGVPVAWMALSEFELQANQTRQMSLHRTQLDAVPNLLGLQRLGMASEDLAPDQQAQALALTEQLRHAWRDRTENTDVLAALDDVAQAVRQPGAKPLDERRSKLQALTLALAAQDARMHEAGAIDALSAAILESLPELVRVASLSTWQPPGAGDADFLHLLQHHQYLVARIAEPDLRASLSLANVRTPAHLLDSLPSLQARLIATSTNILEAHRQEQRMRWLLHALAVAGLLALILYVTASVQVSIMSRLKSMGEMVQAMERADFSHRIRVDGRGEVANMLDSMNASFDKLTDLIQVVQNGVMAVQFATEQLASGNADLAQRNRRTTDGLQGVVQSVSRYAAQLQSCGEEVERMAEVVQRLRLDSANSRKQMTRLQERMDALRNHSQEISQIVTLIDAIAFRTNVLALNASIEASKAGESGRGFAVVAEEVRSLAMRSADSSRKIADIVRRSTEDIDLSAAMASEAGRAIMGSEEHIHSVHTAINGVAHLTREGEQESGTILAEIRSLSEVTERNTELVDQLANASRALTTQGQNLSSKVNQFQVV